MARAVPRWLGRIVVLLFVGAVGAVQAQAGTPSAHADNVVIILVDGLRPDALKQAKVPNVDSLIKRGASTMKAQTVTPSLTLPAVTSMLAGLTVEQHGVDWNEYEPMRGYLKAPTLFEIASFNGSKWGAMFITKEKLLYLAKPDRRLILQVCSVNEQGCHAQKVAADVITVYRQASDSTKPALFLIHLPDADLAGHAKGWMSKPYLKAVEDCDRAIGTILKGFKELGLYDRTTFIVTADHGGHETTHGTNAPEDMTIPWIAAGPGIKAGYAIKEPVSVVDTPATVMRAFGLSDYYVEWKSRSVEEIFEGAQVAPALSGPGKPIQ
ncbi:MAG TPA: alkaline phosphatase family protein [Nitrospirales bacterium]|nr:alkaline phosphatase family protein [Nitrospirales bacterium]